MRHYFQISILLLLLAGTCYAGSPWDRTDKTLFATWGAIRIVDLGQTHNGLHDPHCIERNPLLRELADRCGPDVVYPYFIAGTIGGYWFVNLLPSGWRKIALLGFIGLQLGNVVQNEKVGIGIKF